MFTLLLLQFNQTGEAQERDGHQARCQQSHGEPIKGFRCVIISNSFTDTRKQHDSQRKTDCAAQRVQDSLNEVVVLLHIQNGNAEALS